MRTVLDLPDEVLRRAESIAARQGYTLSEFILAALRREMASPPPRQRRRLTGPLITLAADAPLRTLSLDEVKRLDLEAETGADLAKINEIDR